MGGQVAGSAIQAHSSGCGIDFQATEPQRGVLSTVAASQNGAQPRQQLSGLEWLWQVVVGPQLQADDSIDRIATRGQHQHRRVPPGAHFAADFQAVHVRKHQIEHHGIIVCARESLECRRSQRRNGHTHAGLAEILAEHLGQARIVFDQQDALDHPANFRG